ncbi:MAG: twin-arginine translocase TatA/TatE family subunit [Bacteroidales bacterium]|nr:twin-arginine translocase TatA/TatE family subunit [Bacteroidales bacterium]
MGILLFISGQEIIFIFLIVLVLFGSKQIPEFAKMAGKGMREFRKATDDIKRQINEETKDVKNDIDDLNKSITS